MANNNIDILKIIKGNYKSAGKPKAGLKLPSQIDFILREQNEVVIKLSADCITSNMQKDRAAFEGWALVLKRWGGFDKIYLSWDEIVNTKDKHYQRFLFRVEQFEKLFRAWFIIDSKSLSFMVHSMILPTGVYVINHPNSARGGIPVTSPKTENELEIYFSNSTELQKLTGLNKIYRQLPVGIFEKSIKAGNMIFTGGKSGIDLYGILKNELKIFELKKAGNRTMGIISELLFYCIVMQQVQGGRFNYDKKVDPDVSMTSTIQAYFLAPALHPLIDVELVNMLNKAMKSKVKFDYITFDGSLIPREVTIY